MTCPAAENLTAFADGELSPAESAAIDQHLRECPACADFVSDMRRLDALGRSSLRQIRITTTSPRARIRFRPSRFRLAVAVAAVLLLAIGGAGWLAMRDRGSTITKTPPPPSSRPAEVATTAPMTFSDEQFEQWAASHRRRRIPLVPLESVATYQTPPVLPFLPAETGSTQRFQ